MEHIYYFEKTFLAFGPFYAFLAQFSLLQLSRIVAKSIKKGVGNLIRGMLEISKNMESLQESVIFQVLQMDKFERGLCLQLFFF